MLKIKKYVDNINDELCSAKKYAENYVYYKAKNDSYWANKYKEMAEDELKHSGFLHEKALSEIDLLRTVYEPTEEMEEKWNTEHKKYVENSTWVRTMLSM